MLGASTFPFEAIIPFLFAGIFLAVFGLIIWSSITQARKARQNLHALGAQLGLGVVEPEKKGAFSMGSTSLQGDYHGRSMRVYAYTTGSGKSRTSWCAVSAQATVPEGFMLKISGENLLTRAGRLFGFEDVATGDSEFDKRFFIKATKVGFIRAAILPEVRARLTEAWVQHGAHGTFSVDATGVKYEETGTFANAKTCARFSLLLELACELADIAEACQE